MAPDLLRTPSKRDGTRRLPYKSMQIVDGQQHGSKFRNSYGAYARQTTGVQTLLPFELRLQRLRFVRKSGSNVKQPSARRPPKLSLNDFECVKVLGLEKGSKVLLVRTTRMSREHDLGGGYFALKAYDKKWIRSFEESNPSGKNIERSILSDLPWTSFANNVVDVFNDARNIYMLFEHIPFGTLRSLLCERGPFDATKASFYFANIACALAFLQSHDIVHRNLTPDTILIDADGYLCLSDFSRASSKDQRSQHWPTVGTLEYMAPESINVGPLAYRSTVDWWAGGCIFFEMLTGEQAFPADSNEPNATMDKILSGDVNWPVKLRIGRNVKSFVESFLNVYPSKRLGHNGYEQVYQHPYFGNIEWAKIERRLYIPPYVPPLPHAVDEWHNYPLPKQTQIPGLRITSPSNLQAHDGRFPQAATLHLML